MRTDRSHKTGGMLITLVRDNITDIPSTINTHNTELQMVKVHINNTKLPKYLCDLIRLNVKSTTIRTRASFDPCLLCVPPISKTCANSIFDRSFVYAAPTLWNALDLDIRLLPFDTFKKSVKTHLYLKCFVN